MVSAWAEQKCQSTLATTQKYVSKSELFLGFLLEDEGVKVFPVYVEILFFHCESEPLDFHLDIITDFIQWL